MQRDLRKTPFAKMHGAGNDFVILDGREPFNVSLDQIAIAVCRPHFSIGADGLIVVQTSQKADLAMLYFNADGGKTICGNGMRCVARYAYENGLVPKDKTKFTLETDAGVVPVEIFENGARVKVNMGKPTFNGTEIPVAATGEFINSTLDVDGEKFEFTAVGIGNPHCVIFVEDLKKVDLHRIGPKIENHEFFPKRTNVEFLKMESPQLGKMIVWERGVGETYACGTGLAASFAAAVRTKRVAPQAEFRTKGGEFQLSWDTETNEVSLTGPAALAFRGEFDCQQLLGQSQTLNEL